MSKLLAEWFWTDRWMGSSAFLLPIGPRGLYREMLTQAWRRGGRLPNNHEVIRRAVGCTLQEWNRCWPSVKGYWRVDGDGLVNDTQLEVYAEAIGIQERASARGRKGALARAQALAQANAQAQPEHVLEVQPPSPSPSVLPSVEHVGAHAFDRARRSHPLDERPRSVLSPEAVEAGDRFLAAYPVKQNQAAAKRAWITLNPDDDTIAAIFQNLEDRERLGWSKNARFVPYPARFLEDGMWRETYIPRDDAKPSQRSVPAADTTSDYLAKHRAARG